MEDLSQILSEHYKEIERIEFENHAHNNQILNEINCSQTDYDDLIQDCKVTDKIEIVENPEGEDNNESYGIFEMVFIDEKRNGILEEFIVGFIYAKFGENKWLKVPYEC